jgi:hypothetical protein
LSRDNSTEIGNGSNLNPILEPEFCIEDLELIKIENVSKADKENQSTAINAKVSCFPIFNSI